VPGCAEQIEYPAHVCRYCGYRFDGAGYARGSMLRAIYAPGRADRQGAVALAPVPAQRHGHAQRELPPAEVE
jgi:hypothetical protein